MLRILVIALVVVACLPVVVWLWFEYVANPRVARELRTDPDGERAGKVMLLTLPSGREIPVNYLRQGDRVYAGADGRWWRELVGDGAHVRVFVRGRELAGRARAVVDDPEYTERIFRELRPKAVKGFGTLIEIRLEEGAPRALDGVPGGRTPVPGQDSLTG